MKIFISWSGDCSKKVASALKDWLEDVFQGTTVFMSDTDIQAGVRWNQILEIELGTSHFGIICLTPQNLYAPWLLFEAGALSKSLKSHVVPYLMNFETTDISGPLGQFQGVLSNKEGTLKLVKSINAVKENPLTNEKLANAFLRWWEDLEIKLSNIINENELPKAEITEKSMLKEILTILKEVARSPQLYQEKFDEIPFKSELEPMPIYSSSDLRKMDNIEINNYLTELQWRLSLTNLVQEKEKLMRLMGFAYKVLGSRKKEGK